MRSPKPTLLHPHVYPCQISFESTRLPWEGAGPVAMLCLSGVWCRRLAHGSAYLGSHASVRNKGSPRGAERIRTAVRSAETARGGRPPAPATRPPGISCRLKACIKRRAEASPQANQGLGSERSDGGERVGGGNRYRSPFHSSGPRRAHGSCAWHACQRDVPEIKCPPATTDHSARCRRLPVRRGDPNSPHELPHAEPNDGPAIRRDRHRDSRRA